MFKLTRLFPGLSLTPTNSKLLSLCATPSPIAHSFLQTRSVSSQFRTRTVSTTKHLKYKAKNHKGAISRWLPLPNGNFLRKKACTKANGKYVRKWKRRRDKILVLANPCKRRMLQKLIPYWKTVRRSYGGIDVYNEFAHLVK